MPPYAFISYRRSDAAQTARALYFQLRLRYGSRQVFMDVNAIQPGDAWPDRLKRALERSTVVLALLGPGWLTAADRYGRRRIDDPDDWVQRELAVALAEAGKVVIPIRVGGLAELPPAEALPACLTGLPGRQRYELRDEYWEADVQQLSDLLRRDHGFAPANADVARPAPERTDPPLTQEQLDRALVALPRWEPVETMIVQEYPHARHELRRAYRFRRFASAIDFIAQLGPVVHAMQHHPRIENQWRTVVVAFTTWDIGNRLTQLDIDAALAADRVYRDVTGDD